MFEKTSNIFLQPNRTYYLEDPEENADGWVDKVEEVHNVYFGKLEDTSTS
jgi:hypothetical protein